jgi:hypothetical protein
MLFDSWPITIFILVVMGAAGYGIMIFLKREGSRPFTKREYIGFSVIFILMLCAGIYAFTTDFGAY